MKRQDRVIEEPRVTKWGETETEEKPVKIELVNERERWGKIALFGLHPVARVIASFVIGVTRKRDIRFFKKKEEALQWLKE